MSQGLPADPAPGAAACAAGHAAAADERHPGRAARRRVVLWKMVWRWEMIWIFEGSFFMVNCEWCGSCWRIAYIYIYTLFCDFLIGNYGKIFWYDWYLWNLVKNPAVKGGSEGATGSFPDVNYIYVWYWNYGCLWRGKLWMIYGIWIDFPKTCNEDVWIFCGDNDDVNVPMYFRKKMDGHFLFWEFVTPPYTLL